MWREKVENFSTLVDFAAVMSHVLGSPRMAGNFFAFCSCLSVSVSWALDSETKLLMHQPLLPPQTPPFHFRSLKDLADVKESMNSHFIFHTTRSQKRTERKDGGTIHLPTCICVHTIYQLTASIVFCDFNVTKMLLLLRLMINATQFWEVGFLGLQSVPVLLYQSHISQSHVSLGRARAFWSFKTNHRQKHI